MHSVLECVIACLTSKPDTMVKIKGFLRHEINKKLEVACLTSAANLCHVYPTRVIDNSITAVTIVTAARSATALSCVCLVVVFF
jgi:hypothetical protein